MPFLPVNIDVSAKTVIIVGGGHVATRKCRLVLDAGASITVISPHLSESLRHLVTEGSVKHIGRPYRSGDLRGAFLAFAATSEAEVNRLVAEEARALGVLVNVADSLSLCDITLPSTIRRGDFVVTVSTTGKCPALASTTRRRLEALFGPEYAFLLNLLAAVREKLLTENSSSAYNNKILSNLLAHDLPALLQRGALTELDLLLLENLGPGYTLAEIGFCDKDIT